MKTKVIFLFLNFLFSLQSLFSKEIILPDYIVLHSNDTLFGSVGLGSLKRVGSCISFTHSGQNVAVKYHPLRVKEFRCKGNMYRSKPLPPAAGDTSDIRFLSVCNRGRVSLYAYTDVDNEKHFLIEKNDSLTELVYSKNIVASDSLSGNNGFIEKKKLRYRWQLKYYLHEMPQLYSLIDQADYYEKELMEIVKRYNENFTGEPAYVSPKSKEKTSVRFGVTAGVSLGLLNFSSDLDDFNYLEQSDLVSKVNLCIGGHVEYRFPVLNKRLSLCQELLYTAYKIESEYISLLNRYYKSNFDLSYIKLNNQFRLYFPELRGVEPFLGAGAGVAYALKTNRSYVYKHPDLAWDSGTPVKSFRKIQMFALASVGGRYRKIVFDYRFEYGGGVSEVITLGSVFVTHYVTMQYSF